MVFFRLISSIFLSLQMKPQLMSLQINGFSSGVKLTNLSLSLSQSQAKPSQAKAWAEVFYIITMCAVLSRPHPRAGDSLISQLLLTRIKPNFQDNLGPIQGPSWWQKILHLQSQNPIFWQKRVKNPQNQPKTQPTQIWLNFSG